MSECNRNESNGGMVMFLSFVHFVGINVVYCQEALEFLWLLGLGLKLYLKWCFILIGIDG